MPINQASKPVTCIACGKIIAQGFIVSGSIQIQCKCGVKNRIEAEQKPEGRSRLVEAVDALGIGLASQLPIR
jgi:hypothetical protein